MSGGSDRNHEPDPYLRAQAANIGRRQALKIATPHWEAALDPDRHDSRVNTGYRDPGPSRDHDYGIGD